MKDVLEFLAVFVAGPLLGVEFAVAAFVNPMLAPLSDDAFSTARRASGRLLGAVMPFWYVAALALLIAVAVVSHSALVIAATVAMLAVQLLTVTVLVPINNRIARWEPGDEAPRRLAARWDRLHWVRVSVLAAVFVLAVVAVVR
jgi:hypothetical protein